MQIKACAIASLSVSLLAFSTHGRATLPYPASAASQRAPISPEKRAYASALIEALDRYDREWMAHKDDPRASRWVAWSGHGHRLLALGDSSMFLFVLHGYGSEKARFGVGLDERDQGCVATTVRQRVLSFERKPTPFKGLCIDGMWAFIPVDRSEQVRLKQQRGGRLSVRSVDTRANFDLSGVPVLNAMLAAEELGSPPSD